MFYLKLPFLQLLVRKIRRRLALIYRALGDEDQYNTHIRLANQTDSALGLNCGACGEVFGLEPDSLEVLPCAHILHARLVCLDIAKCCKKYLYEFRHSFY